MNKTKKGITIIFSGVFNQVQPRRVKSDDNKTEPIEITSIAEELLSDIEEIIVDIHESVEVSSNKNFDGDYNVTQISRTYTLSEVFIIVNTFNDGNLIVIVNYPEEEENEELIEALRKKFRGQRIIVT